MTMKQKLIYPYNRFLDEWNPHLVRYVRNEISSNEDNNSRLMSYCKIVGELQKAGISVNNEAVNNMLAKDPTRITVDKTYAEWFSKWNTAQSALRNASIYIPEMMKNYDQYPKQTRLDILSDWFKACDSQKSNEQTQSLMRNVDITAGIYPLAYRLDPILSEPLDSDPIVGSKFGGVPDFRREYQFKNKDETKLLDIIEKLWPKCGECGEHMNFLAGVDLSDWILPIHFLTANEPTHTDYNTKIENSQIHYYQHSGLGYGDKLGANFWPASRIFFNIFYCDTKHYGSHAHDAMILSEKRVENYEFPDNKILDLEKYKNIISEFVKSKNIKSSIPIQNVEGASLRFDIDAPGDNAKDWMEDVTELFPEIFGKKSPYQFFGRPHSQQDEARYGCQNTSDGINALGLHRMAPIVNWTNENIDVSNQLYGCFKCVGNETNKIYCKNDRSNS